MPKPPSMLGSPGAFQVPAPSAAPSAQARKGRGPAENPFNPMEFSKSRARFRAWVLGQEREAGGWGRDEIREIEGALQRLPQPQSGYVWLPSGLTGAFSIDNDSGRSTSTMSGINFTSNPTKVLFKASNVVPTGPMNVPPHIWQPIILYLGCPR